MGIENHRCHGLRECDLPCRRELSRWSVAAALAVGVLGACASASLPCATAASVERSAAAAPRSSGMTQQKERDELLQRRAQERLRLELQIRDHDSRLVRDPQ
jgi:hypothetical protein